PVAPGRTVVASEEPLGLLIPRADKLGFGTNVHWCSRPFPVQPSTAEWEDLILELSMIEADLVVIDPLVMVLPGDVENNATSLLLELSADGLDYRTVAEPPPESFDQNWALLKSVFAEATNRLTRQEVHKYWPPDFDKPSLSTVTRWLERALQENRIVRKGKG